MQTLVKLRPTAILWLSKSGTCAEKCPVAGAFARPWCDMRFPILASRRDETGFTLLDMLFVMAIMSLLATLAIPGLMRARVAAHSTSALGTLRVINSAELSYAITCGLGFYAPDLPTLGVAPPGATDAFLPAELSAGPTVVKSGYTFSLAGIGLAGAPGSCNGLAAGLASPGYAVVADPLDPLYLRYFGTNADAVIYEDTATYSATMPETGAPPGGGPIR